MNYYKVCHLVFQCIIDDYRICTHKVLQPLGQLLNLGGFRLLHKSLWPFYMRKHETVTK